MSSKTKILVLKLKEIIYTLIFVVLAVVLIVLLVLIFTGRSKKNETKVSSTFAPGVFTASIMLSGNPVDIEVTVDSQQIKKIDLISTSESIETMYPLISSSLKHIEQQVIADNSTEHITYDQDNKYTSIVLVKAINQALEKASPS